MLVCVRSFNVPRATGLFIATLGALGVAVGLVWPWARTGDVHPPGWAIAALALALAVPVAAAARLAYRRFDRLGPSGLAAAGALIAGFVAYGVAFKVDPADGVRAGGPLTVAGALTAALGWAVVAVVAERPVAPAGRRRRLLVAAIASAALLAVDVVVVHWATVGRFVDEGGGSATAVPAPVGDLAGERWHSSVPAGGLLGVAGAQFYVTDGSGVRAYATRDGKATWHYRRSDLGLSAAVLAGGAVVTAHRSRTDLVLVSAHDATTGAELFADWFVHRADGPLKLVAIGRLVILTGVGHTRGDVIAFDAHSGAERWRYRPDNGRGQCEVNSAAAAGKVLAVAQRCYDDVAVESVVGLSTADGRQRWAWQPTYAAGQSHSGGLTIDAAGSGFIVHYGDDPGTAVVLDANGAPGARYAEPEFFRGVVGEAAIYSQNLGKTGGEAAAVSIRTGARLWQTKQPSLAGWTVSGTVLTDQRLYTVLTRSDAMDAPGPVRVLALEPADGRAIADRELSWQAEFLDGSIAADRTSVVVRAGGQVASLG